MTDAVFEGPALEGLSATQVGLRVAVTGANGYLGRPLVGALRRLGCEVTACDIAVGDPALHGARWETVDVRDRGALARAFEGCEVVFHTAAALSLAGLAPKAIVDRVWSVNVDGTQAVIDACRDAGVGRLVHTSSANVVIDRELVEVDESVPYAAHWVDQYGPSKAEGERRVLAANGPTLRTVALRPGGIWGPGEGGFMVKTFLGQLAAGRFVATIGDGTAVVDNTHVSNLVRAELLAAIALGEQGDAVGGQAYFITDDERINGIEWFRPICEGLGCSFPSFHLPAALMYGVALAGEVGHRLGLPEPDLTRIGVVKLTKSTAFSIDAARHDLGYAPLVKRDEGVAAHLEDYRATYPTLRGDPPRKVRGAKVVVVLWARERLDPAARGRRLLEELAPKLLERSERLTVYVADEHVTIDSPSPFPLRGERQVAMIDCWPNGDPREVVRLCEAAGFVAHAWPAEESVPTDYGDNEHAASRDWPDGVRSPGIAVVSLLPRPRRLDREAWVERWHGVMSPVSARIQPRTRYVRNLLGAALTEGAPGYEGAVVEDWPSPEHVKNPRLFYGARTGWELVKNQLAIVRAVSSCFPIHRIPAVPMSEHFVRS